MFLLGPLLYPGEMKKKTKVVQSFGGHTRCIMGDVQMAYKYFGLTMNQDPDSALSEFRW